MRSLLVVFLFMQIPAFAADLVWSGKYRFEGIRVSSPDLAGGNKAYMLNHLSLTPKIVAADGLTVFAKFGIFNDSTYGAQGTYGSFLGQGPATGTPTNATNSNSISRYQAPGSLLIPELYVSWIQEFGQLVVGRSPLHFGFGGYVNSGKGLFDKYSRTLDMVGYKVVIGNFFVMPIVGKVSEGTVSTEDDINDNIIHAQYENPDSEIAIGFWMNWRNAAIAGNDVPTNFGGSAATRTGGLDTLHKGAYLKQKGDSWDLGIEMHQMEGGTGLRTASGTGVGINSYAFLGEFGFRRKDSPWTFNTKFGVVSGDDPTSDDVYEGFILSQNYDLGMLLFNHPLGQNDFLRTSMLRGTGAGQPDTEAISNAGYLSPSFQHQWNPRLSWGARLVWGSLVKEPIAGSGTARNLGYEIDLNVTYKPYERMIWTTEIGYLLPGDAWAGGTNGYTKTAPFGVMTKAAIHF